MSVIIRLQNLPWAANARDIRSFFSGLSIPEGGVHIIGGEMGDAFIAFSTDEDARKAMLKDRDKLMEVQVRLLLSSRAEMQKVIETARQQALLLQQQQAAAMTATPVVKPVAAVVDLTNQMPPVPNPPIISASGFQNVLTPPAAVAAASKPPSFLTYQQQAGITLAEVASYGSKTPKVESPDTRRRSNSRERRRSRSHSRERHSNRRSRHERSRSRSRELDWRSSRNGGRSRRRSSSSRDSSRERSRERARNSATASGVRASRENSRSNDQPLKPKQENISPWSIPPLSLTMESSSTSLNPLGNIGSNVSIPGLQTSFSTASNSFGSQLSNLLPKAQSQTTVASITGSATTALPAFQLLGANTTTTNNYSINFPNIAASAVSSTTGTLGIKNPISLQNPYVAALQSGTANKLSGSAEPLNALTASLAQVAATKTAGNIYQPQKIDFGATLTPAATLTNVDAGLKSGAAAPISTEPIAFASVNPYEQMYPQLFEQAASRIATANSPTQRSSTAQVNNSPKTSNNHAVTTTTPPEVESCCVKISNMCHSTTYSDLRKFFAGLFIPHNGIKIVNDNSGQRIGIAYIEFSRVSSAQKALLRNNAEFKGNYIKVDPISDDLFEKAEDSYRPSKRHDDNYQKGNSSPGYSSPGGGTVKVLFLEDLPQLTTEQDILKMFSPFTIVDILLTVSPHSRREYVAYVHFSREEEARAALADTSRHAIGYRKIRVRAGNLSDMEATKEKLRLANEQLMKEEAALSRECTDEKDMDIDDSRSNDSNDASEHHHSRDRHNGGGSYLVDPRRRNQQQSHRGNSHEPAGAVNERPKENNFQPPPLMSINSQIGAPQQQQHNKNNNNNSFNSSPMEDNFVIVSNCEYGTRINDLGELLSSANLRMNHIEMLYNERNLPAGEFIIEFCSSRDANMAIREFHNRRFRGRNVRYAHITPQEIANRLGKPFMNYIPGGGGRQCGNGNSGSGNNNHNDNGNDGQQLMQAALELISRGVVGPVPNNIQQQLQEANMRQNRFSDRNDNDRGGNGGGGNKHRNPFANERDGDHSNNYDDGPFNNSNNSMPDSNSNSGGGGADDGIPDKFNRPGCVIAMRNVPFKANLKDILRFFGDYSLQPEDIIRRFNDDGTATGDARVAFESPAQARSAYESKRRRQMFNRNVFLSIL